MPVDVAKAAAEPVNRWAAENPRFAVVWHGGEPLAAGRRALAELMDPFVGVDHQIQTNAILINDAWCEFFAERRIRVSISVDGPEDLNHHRVIRGFGRPAYARIVKGAAALRRNGIDFAALCVVSEPRKGLAKRLYEYFLELGCDSIGISMEEQEGVNTRTHDEGDEAVQTFWAELLEAWHHDPRIHIREIDHFMHYCASTLHDDRENVLPRQIDPMPMITPDGRVYMLSPELAGFSDPRYGDFSAGNVLTSPLEAIIADAIANSPWIAEYLRGVETCRQTCSYFGFCGGAQAGNRYFEHHRFDQTRTNHCLNSKIRLLEGALDYVNTQ